MKLVATSIWRGITYRTGIIEHHGIKHHRFRVEAVGWAAITTCGQTKEAPEGARRTVTVSQSVDAVEGVEASLFIISY